MKVQGKKFYPEGIFQPAGQKERSGAGGADDHRRVHGRKLQRNGDGEISVAAHDVYLMLVFNF